MIVNWSGLDSSEQAEITPTLASTDNWIILTHPLGPEKTITPPISASAKIILCTKRKASREKVLLRTGTDKLASYGLDTRRSESVNVSRSPEPICSTLKNFGRRNLKKTFQICAWMEWSQSI